MEGIVALRGILFVASVCLTLPTVNVKVFGAFSLRVLSEPLQCVIL